MRNIIRRTLISCDVRPKDLSEKSGIPLSTISRYLNGSRVPDKNGEQIDRLATALCELIDEHTPQESITHEKMLNILRASIVTESSDYWKQLSVDNLRKLIIEMGISASKLANGIYYSPSGMSRIMSKQNAPREVSSFVDSIVGFVISSYQGPSKLTELQKLTELCTGHKAGSVEDIADTLYDWLIEEAPLNEDGDPGELLRAIDEYNYEEYLSSEDQELINSIPVTIIRIPVTKRYNNGQSGLETGITDFFKATVTSASNEDVFVFSDHPIDELSENEETIEKWVKALGVSILQGKNIQVIHNVNRPLKELVQGVKKWLPLYMTGKIQSYYSDRTGGNLFNHILLVSGAAVFSGHSAGSMSEGSYILSKNMMQISEGRKNADSLLKECNTLVGVYSHENHADYEAFMEKDADVEGDRIAFSDCLPIYTMSEELIDRIAEFNQFDEDEIDSIKKYINNEKKRIDRILQHSEIRECVRVTDDSIQEPQTNAEHLLYVKDSIIRYSSADYKEHLKLTEEYVSGRKNLSLIKRKNELFKNIRIVSCIGSYVKISRNIGKEMHLLIKHPDITDSIVELIYKEAGI